MIILGGEGRKKMPGREQTETAAIAQAMLAQELPEDELKEELRDRGFATNEAAAVLYAMLQRAKAGNVSAAKFFAEMAGWKPAEQGERPFSLEVPLSAEELRGMSDSSIVRLLQKEKRGRK